MSDVVRAPRVDGRPALDLAVVAEILNRFPEATWDRCGRGEWPDGSGHYGMAFGWIPRDDGRFDFLRVEWVDHDSQDSITFGLSTSSALYSREFAERLHGPEAEHSDCERVEAVFGDLVEKKIVLAESA